MIRSPAMKLGEIRQAKDVVLQSMVAETKKKEARKAIKVARIQMHSRGEELGQATDKV